MTSLERPPRDERRRRLWRRRDETLTQKASLNMLAAVLDYTARVIVGLFANPVLVSRLGDVAFGVYQVLTRLVQYATPAGGRPSQALKWTIARHQHSDAYDEKRLQVGSAITVWFLFLPALAAAGGALAWFAPLLVGAPESLHTTIRIAAAVLVGDLIVTNLVTIPQSVVQGENLGYKRMGLSTVVVLVGGGLTVTMAILGAGLVGVAAAALTTTALTGALFWWVARRHVTWFGAARAPWRTVRSFVQLSGWFLLWNLVMQVMRGGDVVVLGIAGSPELVTVYALARYVPEAIFGAVAITISGIMPGLGGLLGGRELARAVNVRADSMAVTWLLATASGATFLLWHESFLRLWVGVQYVPGRVETLLIVALILQFAFIRNDASIIDLTLELRAKVLLGILSAVLSIGLGAVLVAVWELGIAGLVAGFLGGRAILTVAYPWLVSRYLGLSLGPQLLSSVRPLLVSAGLFAAAVLGAPTADVGSWAALLPGTVLTLAALGPTALFLGLTGKQRHRLAARARGVVRGA